MLGLTHLCGFGAVASQVITPPSLSFIGYTEDGTQKTTYVFNGVAIGAADPTRRVVVAAHWRDAAVHRTITAASINGTSILPAHVLVVNSNVDTGDSGIFSLLVPTGTTANFSFTLNVDADDFAIAVYRAINESVATPHAVMSDNTNPFSGTLNIPNNGWVVAGGVFSVAPPTPAWTGITEQYDNTIGDAGISCSGGFASLLPTQTPRTISETGGTNGGICAMSWG